MSAVETALRAVTDFCEAQGIDHEPGLREGEVVVVLPGEHKLRTVVSVQVRPRGLSATAFVIRHPDEEHERFYRLLLSRNLGLPGVAYAIDPHGDVWVRASVPLAAVDEDYLDGLFGAILQAADDAFDELLAIGFLTAIRAEWAWRRSRGESTRNLEAFRHLLEPPGDAAPPE